MQGNGAIYITLLLLIIFILFYKGSSGLPAFDRNTLDLSVHKTHVGLFSARPVADPNLLGTGDYVSHGQKREASWSPLFSNLVRRRLQGLSGWLEFWNDTIRDPATTAWDGLFVDLVCQHGTTAGKGTTGAEVDERRHPSLNSQKGRQRSRTTNCQHTTRIVGLRHLPCHRHRGHHNLQGNRQSRIWRSCSSRLWKRGSWNCRRRRRHC